MASDLLLHSRRIPSSSLLIFANSALLIVRPTLILLHNRRARSEACPVWREKACGEKDREGRLLSKVHFASLDLEHVGFDRLFHDEADSLHGHRLPKTIDPVNRLILWKRCSICVRSYSSAAGHEQKGAHFDGRVPEGFHEINSASRSEVQPDRKFSGQLPILTPSRSGFGKRQLTRHRQLEATRGALRISDQP